MRTLIILVLCGLLFSSCATLTNTWDNTTFTYNAKKGKVNAKTKVGKHLVLKY